MTTETAAAPSTEGLQKQTQIIFAAGRPDPSPDSISAIKGLAGPLNSALDSGAARIQVVAYGGQPGDKSSDARRLSLQRARVIRQLLIEGGVPAERIDVRAMGGATDGQASDRVDVFTKV
jgi:outer membrane protein OmpA-like peptidoglycan-associated protein